MPDISMCGIEKIKCARTTECHRHPDSGTKPSEHQTWARFSPESVLECEAFWLVYELEEEAV